MGRVNPVGSKIIHGKPYEWGVSEKGIPYIIRETGSPAVIVFEPSRDLLKSLVTRVEYIIGNMNRILPEECSLCVLGYDQNLPEDHSYEDMASSYAELIREKFQPGTVIGVSYGGFLAIPFAAAYPELTEKLILIVAGYEASTKGVQLAEDLIGLMREGKTYEILQQFNSLIHRKTIRWLARFMTWRKKHAIEEDNNPPSTFINAYEHIRRNKGENRRFLPLIQAPSLVIGGDRDQFFSKEIFEETAALIPNGKLELFAGEGHYVILERIREIRRILSAFII